MKIIKLIGARKVLSALTNEQISIRLAYDIAKFLEKTDNDEKFYFDKGRDITNQYATVNADGNYTVEAEKVADFQKEMNDLENLEVDVPKIALTLDILENTFKTISIAQINTLMDFIEGDSDEDIKIK